MREPTTSSQRVVKDGVVTWNNHQGTKQNHEVNATQMNSKNIETGDHTFYNTKTGRSGVALGGAERKGQSKK